MFIAGVDEAGRGALAGPVVAAAVIFTRGQDKSGYEDSKKLTPGQREKLYKHILRESLAVGVGVVDQRVIDKVNILKATFLAMKKAVDKLRIPPDLVLVDGNQRCPHLTMSQKTVVRGDERLPIISAASIVAKVLRDRLMTSFARVYPLYEFERHKGYGTALHIEKIHANGYCPIHRRSFNISKPLRLF